LVTEDRDLKLTYDPQYNIAYIQLRPKSGKVKTIQVSEELNVDLARDGTIYGVELLNANEQLAKGTSFVFENVTTGRREKLSVGR
jgi:uncharacterized protein YuzE